MGTQKTMRLDKSNTHISIATTACNEEQCLPQFIQRTKNALESANVTFEIVIVDDGSKDNTWNIIKLAAKKDDRIKAFRLSRNFGHQRALVRAMEECTSNIVCTIDSDLQDPPELIPELLNQLHDNNADLIYGQRTKRKKTNPILLLAYHTFYSILQMLSGTPIPPNTGDFRVAKRRVVESVLALKESHDFLRGAFAWVGFKQEAFLYERDGREAGKSSYTINKLLELAVNGLWGFSMKPLRLAIIFALVLSCITGFLALYIFQGYLINRSTPPGWTSLALAILITGTANLLALGTLAEYLGQILKITRNRPGTLVSESTES